MAQKRPSSSALPAAKRPSQPAFTLHRTVPRGFLKSFRSEGSNLDVPSFFEWLYPDLIQLLNTELNQHQFKAVFVLHVKLEKAQGEFILVCYSPLLAWLSVRVSILLFPQEMVLYTS